jgi:hypothetical protein
MEMILMKIHEEFTIRASCWLPEFPEKEIPSELTYTWESGPKLEVNGHFHEPKGLDFGASIIPIIHGVDVKGKFFTLLNTHKTNISVGSAPKEIYSAHFMIFDILVNEVDPYFDKINFGYFFLDLWLRHFPIKSSVFSDPKCRSISFQFPAMDLYKIPEENLGVELNGNFFSSGEPFNSIKWDYESSFDCFGLEKILRKKDMFHRIQKLRQICIVHSRHYRKLILRKRRSIISRKDSKRKGFYPRKLSSLFEGMTHFSRLLEILWGDRPILYKAALIKEQRIFPILFRYPFSKPNSSKHVFDFPFFYTDIKESFGGLLQKWLGLEKSIDSLLNLLFSSMDERSIYIEHKFQNLIHGLEGYSRWKGKDTYLPEEAYQKAISPLYQEVGKLGFSDLKDALKNRIRYGNNHSLRKRLNTLLNNLPLAVINRIILDKKRFVTEIVDTRNYFSHYDDSLKDLALKNIDLYMAKNSLQLLFQSIILLEIGLGNDLIQKYLSFILKNKQVFEV